MGPAAGTAVSLEQLSNDAGRFAVLAIDHRDSLRRFLSPDDPAALSAGALTALKIEMVTALAGEATGVMLEPEYSIPQVIDAGALPDGVGFLAALEAQGYYDDPGSAVTTILDGWSVEQAAASGAAAAKLLLPYHPDKPNAGAQQDVGASITAECQRVGIPIVLEPLFYDLADPADRPRVVLETARQFAAIGPDLLKLPFPVDTAVTGDRRVWAAVCADVSKTVPMPWALLSGGGSFDDFADQLEVAMVAGCSGFMVGRALWGEAARAEPAERADLLTDLVAPRLRALRAIVENHQGAD